MQNAFALVIINKAFHFDSGLDLLAKMEQLYTTRQINDQPQVLIYGFDKENEEDSVPSEQSDYHVMYGKPPGMAETARALVAAGLMSK